MNQPLICDTVLLTMPEKTVCDWILNFYRMGNPWSTEQSPDPDIPKPLCRVPSVNVSLQITYIIHHWITEYNNKLSSHEIPTDIINMIHNIIN